MPYILDEKREKFEAEINKLIEKLAEDKENFEGNLNYIFTKLILGLKLNGYKEMNGAIGTLECCKLELYRRFIASYEDKKIQENGDVQ